MNSLGNVEISQSTYSFDMRLQNSDTVAEFLDANFPLNEGSHSNVTQYRVYFDSLVAHLKTGHCVGLMNPRQFGDYEGEKECPSLIVLDDGDHQFQLQL